MARKNGCPTSVRDWSFEIRSRTSTNADPEWIRIKGVNSMDYGVDSDTEDGSSASDLYSENYVTKRNVTLSLEMKPVTDIVTGAHDRGQAELDYYATQGGCDGDARIRIADTCGHATLLDVIVTSRSQSADDTSETLSYDLDIVGEPIDEPYVQVASVTTTPASSASVDVGEVQSVTVALTPTGASNSKYSVASADTSKVKVSNIDGMTFDIVGVAATEAETPVNVVVTTMNNKKQATIAVTVTAV